MKNYVIILASGTGSRCGSDIPKQFIKIAGKTIFEHTVGIFEGLKEIDDHIFFLACDAYEVSNVRENDYEE